MEVAKVNVPVGVLIWVMIIPMLLASTSRRWGRCVSTGAASA